MLSKRRTQRKVRIITLGCSKNLVDSETLAQQLAANDFEVRHDSAVDADYQIAVVNTCGFIQKAKEESVQTILEQVDLKKSGKIEKVYVSGCLSQRYRADLEREIPEVDAYFGTMELPRILATLQADYKKELLGARLLGTPPHYAYVKIAEGCNRTCAFCAIPLMRGAHRSRLIEEIVQEVEALVRMGVKEIMLIAQELTYYGLDIYKKRRLADLLEALVRVAGLVWIRLHYAYPAKFPEEVIVVMARETKICSYLDMPLQHASDAMLAKMKRGMTQEETRALIGRIRETVPDITLRTTFLVGFPGETEADIEELEAFIREMRFDRVGVFTYSHEEGTAAMQYGDILSEVEKENRAERIMAVQQAISYEKNQRKIGRVLEVLIDKKEAGVFIGRTQADSPEVDNEVLIRTEEALVIGDLVRVRITKAYDYDLEGVVTGDYEGG